MNRYIYIYGYWNSINTYGFESTGDFYQLSDKYIPHLPNQGLFILFLNKENLKRYIDNEDNHKVFDNRKFLKKAFKKWEMLEKVEDELKRWELLEGIEEEDNG